MFLTQFTVRGKGHFPLDMLRYDRCFPITPEAVLDLVDASKDNRNIELGMYHATKLNFPCEGRWNSFGWAELKNMRRTTKF